MIDYSYIKEAAYVTQVQAPLVVRMVKPLLIPFKVGNKKHYVLLIDDKGGKHRESLAKFMHDVSRLRAEHKKALGKNVFSPKSFEDIESDKPGVLLEGGT